jgi:hypothetical protein
LPEPLGGVLHGAQAAASGAEDQPGDERHADAQHGDAHGQHCRPQFTEHALARETRQHGDAADALALDDNRCGFPAALRQLSERGLPVELWQFDRLHLVVGAGRAVTHRHENRGEDAAVLIAHIGGDVKRRVGLHRARNVRCD